MIALALAVLVSTVVVGAEQVGGQYRAVYTTSSCPCPVYFKVLQPVHFTQYLTTSSVIQPFPDSDLLTISSWPTNVQLSTTLTHIQTGCTQLVTSTLTSIASSAATPQSLYIGQGLPQGSQASLSEFLFLAYQPAAATGLVKRDLQPRQAVSVSSVRALNLAQATGSYESPGQENCDDASPLLLLNGRLIQYDNSVAKRVGDTLPLLGFILPPPVNEVNTSFSITNGYLDWNVPDVNVAATWLVCGNGLYAAFAVQAPMGCTPVLVGAIAGSACLQRVSSRVANPQFVAPSPIQRTSLLATSSTLISPVSQVSSVPTPSTSSSANDVTSSVMTSATIGSAMASSSASSLVTQSSQVPSVSSTPVQSSLSLATSVSSNQLAMSSSVTIATTSASTPTTTSTTTSTTTYTTTSATSTTTTFATPSATACIPPGTNKFKLRANDPSGQYMGANGQATPNTQTTGAVSFFGSVNTGTTFSLNAAGNLLVNDATNDYNGYTARTIQGSGQAFRTVSLESTPLAPLLVCSYGTDCLLRCTAGADSVLEICGYYLRLTTLAAGDPGCALVTLRVTDPAAT